MTEAPAPGEVSVCRTCARAITWWPGQVPARPDLSGAWYDTADQRGVRGPGGHEHRP